MKMGKKKEEKKFTFIDLFAGCGGLSEGFLKSGHYEALAHVEWEMPMVETLRNRLVKKWKHSVDDAKKRVIRFDVQRTEELLHGNWHKKSVQEYGADNADAVIQNGLHGIVGDKKVDLIIGGPPCQAYSIAGRAQDPNSMKDDYRNYLFESFVKIVDSFQPKAFVFENVPGILSARPGKKKTNPLVTSLIYRAFDAIGYEIRTPERLKESVYCSVDFQVPQKRNRVIIIGVRRGSGIDVEEIYDSITRHKSTLPQKTLRDAIGGLPRFRPLEEDKKLGRANVSHELIDDCSVTQHNARYHNKRDRGVFLEWIENNLNNATQKEQLEFYQRITGKVSNHNKYRSLDWDKPSPTIVSHLYKDGLMFIHPDIEQLRSITIREAALLQSFPMDFEFLGSNAYCYKMIGNAVPVDFAKGIADAVNDVLKRIK
jgi:DNA (cytosine-5)-methyltransferase 1